MRLAILATAALLAACSPPSGAPNGGRAEAPPDASVGRLEIIDPWAAPSPGGVDVAAGYLIIRNTGEASNRLTAAASPRAQRVEIHDMSHEGGVMRMRELTEGLEIAPGETVALMPEGLHLMFVGVAEPFAPGQDIPVTLTFANAEVITVALPVRRPGAAESAEDHNLH